MNKPIKGLVSAIIVSWNSEDTLANCVESLKAQDYQPIELIVVDNGSRDRSLDIVRDIWPQATIIRNEVNLGFCRGQNLGISVSRGEYAMPTNPDIVMNSNYVRALVDAMQQDERIGTVAGRLYLPECVGEAGGRIIDSTGLFLNRARRQYLRGHGEADHGQYGRAGYIFGACGAAPLYRRSMLVDIAVDGEYFDETFFAHKEDVDLAWRAQLLGWKAWYEPTAIAFHDRSFRPVNRNLMSEEVKMHAVKNRYLTIMKNDLSANVLTDALSIISYDARIIGYLILRERTSLVALLRFAKLAPRAWQVRRQIMRRRKVSTKYMRDWIS